MQALVKMIIMAALEWVTGKIVALLTKLHLKKQNHDGAVNEANAGTEKISKITPDSSKEATDAAIDEASRKM